VIMMLLLLIVFWAIAECMHGGDPVVIFDRIAISIALWIVLGYGLRAAWSLSIRGFE